MRASRKKGLLDFFSRRSLPLPYIWVSGILCSYEPKVKREFFGAAPGTIYGDFVQKIQNISDELKKFGLFGDRWPSR
jgi:hypothetical protein